MKGIILAGGNYGSWLKIHDIQRSDAKQPKLLMNELFGV